MKKSIVLVIAMCSIIFMAGVEKKRSITIPDKIESRCFCVGPKWVTAAPVYGQWAWECVSGTNVFYVTGAGFPPPSSPVYMPPPPCQTNL